MRAEAQPTAQHMMLSMNFWSTVFSGVALVLSGEGVSFCHFVSKYPYCLFNIAMLAIAGALGQLFIFLTVSNFKIHRLIEGFM